MAKILLVEDDNNLREIYGERLMAEGYDIVSASDGEEALQTAVTEKPDLIISDVMMPKISGFDMLDILRQTPETKDVKIIMMTALSQAEDKTRADKLGADKYLVKSQVTLEDVARVVHDLLGDGDSVDATVEDASAPAPQTIADTQVADTPVAVAPAPVPAPVEPVVAPVAAPEPVAPAPVVAPVAQPVATTVTPPVVTPPAPVAPAPVEPVVAPVAAPEPVAPAPVVADTPVVNPISGISDQPTAPVAQGAVQAQDSQTELNEVAQQIQQFAADTTMPQLDHEEPVHEPTEQDIIHAQNAAEEPTIVPAAPAAPTVNPTIPPVTPLNTSNPEPASSRKKVISPVSPEGFSTPDIHALYEQEMAKEAATAPVINPESGAVIATPDVEGVQNPISVGAPVDATPPPLETVDTSQISGILTGDEDADAATTAPGTLPPALPTEAPAPTDPSDANNIAL